MNRLRSFYNKYREIINYLIFGVLTTVISFVVYFAVLYFGEHVMNITDETSGRYYALRLVGQILQWVAGVLFAFFTNRKWVFDASDGNVVGQLVKFSASRLTTLGLDTAVTFGMVAALTAGEFAGVRVPVINIVLDSDAIAKITAAVLVVIANYVISKLFVFRKK